MASARILVLRGGAIGDVVLTFPVFQALRERWPEGHLEVVTYPRLAGVLLAGGLVDAARSLEAPDYARLFSFRPEFSPAFREFVRGFDLILNFLYDPDGLVPKNLGAAGARQVFSLDPRPADRHAADHLASILNSLAIFPDRPEPRLDWPARQLPSGLPAGAIALHPGSGSPRKNWPWERYLDLSSRLSARGVPHYFIEGEAERETIPDLASHAGPVLRAADLAGVCDALAGARAFLGNDSGLAHLAAALGRPVTVLFGPSNPDLWAPRGRGGVTVLRGGETWDELDTDTVLEALLRGLA